MCCIKKADLAHDKRKVEKDNIMQTSYGKAEGIWLYSLQNMKQQNKHTSSVYRSALSNQKLNDNRNAMAERSRATAVPMKWQGE